MDVGEEELVAGEFAVGDADVASWPIGMGPSTVSSRGRATGSDPQMQVA
jgi:hypothetical protein